MTDAEYQNMIMLETGIKDGSGTVLIPILSSLVPMWWQANLDNNKSQRLNYLYTTQSVIIYFLAAYKKKKDVVLGPDQYRASQVFNNTLKWLQEHNKRIAIEDVFIGVPTIVTIMPSNPTQERMVQDWVLERVIALDPNFENNWMGVFDNWGWPGGGGYGGWIPELMLP